mmetsp:Transcript_153076/g.489237  ORF Transcript_153076/g.489237 Transcript_153076/m.489237 type:complete len:275 (+) Transcript_153076:571-1395(+)
MERRTRERVIPALAWRLGWALLSLSCRWPTPVSSRGYTAGPTDLAVGCYRGFWEALLQGAQWHSVPAPRFAFVILCFGFVAFARSALAWVDISLGEPSCLGEVSVRSASLLGCLWPAGPHLCAVFARLSPLPCFFACVSVQLGHRCAPRGDCCPRTPWCRLALPRTGVQWPLTGVSHAGAGHPRAGVKLGLRLLDHCAGAGPDVFPGVHCRPGRSRQIAYSEFGIHVFVFGPCALPLVGLERWAFVRCPPLSPPQCAAGGVHLLLAASCWLLGL